MKYRADVDGMRALSVVAVILFHLNLDWIQGGFLGVDVFFVISGFLITYNIVSDLERQQFSLLRFCKKRISRLYPALSFMVVVVVLFVSFVYLQVDKHPVRVQSVASYLSFQNFYLTFSLGDYWSEGAERMPFLHTWSLSVEEQILPVCIPLCLYLLYRLKKQAVCLVRDTDCCDDASASPGFVQGSLKIVRFSAFYLFAHPGCGSLIARLAPGPFQNLPGPPIGRREAFKIGGRFRGIGYGGDRISALRERSCAKCRLSCGDGLGCMPDDLGRGAFDHQPEGVESSADGLRGPLVVFVVSWHWPVVVFNRLCIG